MIESVAIITLAVVCVVQAIILACRRERKPIEWPVAKSIAKSIVKTRERGIAEGETNAAHRRAFAGNSEFTEPLLDAVPYDADEEEQDSQVGPHPDMAPVTDAPLEE